MINHIKLSETYVIHMDDETGNILIYNDCLPSSVSEGESIIIHYEEDDDNIHHEYVVKEIDNENNIATLDWVKQLSENLLTEAPSFVNKLKNVFNPDQATKLAAGEKAAEKAEKKQAKKFADLLKRDIAKGKVDGWLFYIQLPNGKHLNTPMEFKDVALFYNDGNNLNPAIVNAVVTLAKPSDFMMRQGKKDFAGTGTRFSTSYFNIPSNMQDEWKEGDKDRFLEIAEASTNKLKNAIKAQMGEEEQTKQKQPEENQQSTANKNKSVEETPAKNKPEDAKNNNRYDLGISSNTYKHFLKILYVMKPKLYDAFDKPVDVSNINELATKVKYNNLADFEIEIDGKRTPAINWIKTAVKNKVLMEKVLNEAPVVTLSNDEMNNPDAVNFKDAIKRATDKEEQEKREAEKLENQRVFRDKYSYVYEEFKRINRTQSTEDVLEFLFNKLVPFSGKADTVAGEYVRAIMRILYRDYNDGDKFFEGYGLETCGGSAEYLADQDFYEEVINIAKDALMLSDNDAAYTQRITELAQVILDKLNNEEELFYTENTIDSRDYDVDIISDLQPRYDFEFYASDELRQLVEEGIINSWDLRNYVNNWLSYESRYFHDTEVERPWGQHDTSVTVSNLTRDALEYIEDSFDPDNFWQELVDEHADELSDDEDYDEGE